MSIFEKILLSVCAVLVLYFAVCLITVFAEFIHMVRQNKNSRMIDEGKKRFEAIEKEIGKAQFNLYSEKEIRENKSLEKVKLYYFPADEKNIKRTNYCLLIPGGGYMSCDPALVCFGAAALLNRKGIHCFVLNYRVKKEGAGEAPFKDLTRAVEYINENCDKFMVKKDKYCLTGFSAGGHLAALYCERTPSKPASVNLIYPWTGLGSRVRPNLNIVRFIMKAVERKEGLDFFIGRRRTKEQVKRICVTDNLTKDFPPCYLIHGERDMVLDCESNGKRFVRELEKNGTECSYEFIKGVNHGFGVGKGTKAENWLERAYEFMICHFTT